MRWAVAVLILVSFAFAGEPKEYKKGILDHWDMLDTGTNCKTNEGILGGISTRCGSTGVRVYHNGEKKEEFKKYGDPKHEAKYHVNLVEKRKVDTSAPLTNKDVVDMTRLGLSETLIVQKINTSKAGFDVSVAALKLLKDSGVSDGVIAAMMQRQSQ